VTSVVYFTKCDSNISLTEYLLYLAEHNGEKQMQVQSASVIIIIIIIVIIIITTTMFMVLSS